MDETEIKSILDSVKHALGVEEDVTAWDADLVMFINAVFGTLYQLGVGPAQPFTISDNSSEWDEFTTRDDIEMVKSYMYLKVRLLFDPPTTTTMYQALDTSTKELEWRLNVAVDSGVQNAD